MPYAPFLPAKGQGVETPPPKAKAPGAAHAEAMGGGAEAREAFQTDFQKDFKPPKTSVYIHPAPVTGGGKK